MTEIKKQELNEGWIDRLLNKCEEVGVSTHVIQRFNYYYVSQGGDHGAKYDSTTEGAKSPSN